MNKIEALNEKALEAAVLAHDKEEAAMRGEPDPWADERPEDEFADRKAAMAEAIRAYLTAVSTDVSGLVNSTMDRIIQECETERWFLGTVNAREVIRKHIARSLTALEAENAKLREDAERYRALRDGSLDDLAVVRGLGVIDYGLNVVLYTYLKEIEGDEMDNAIDAARRVREGGKVDG